MFHANQSSLFDSQPTDAPDITYLRDWYRDHQSLFLYMQQNLQWNRRFRSRSTVTFGLSYTARGGLRFKRPIAEFLNPLISQIKRDFAFEPNNCLVNYYPTGQHYISFHSDQDMEMMAHSGVAIVSFGATRHMILRKIADHRLRYCYPLPPGSIFYMRDAVQKTWQHGILTEKECGPRISLSFRALRQNTQAAVKPVR